MSKSEFPLNEDGSVNVESEEFRKREAEVMEANELLFTLDSASGKVRKEDRSFLLGRVLTVIDAIGLTPEQQKSVKDLIHSAFDEYKQRDSRLFAEMFNRISEALSAEDRIEMVDNPWEKNRLPTLVPSRYGDCACTGEHVGECKSAVNVI